MASVWVVQCLAYVTCCNTLNSVVLNTLGYEEEEKAGQKKAGLLCSPGAV